MYHPLDLDELTRLLELLHTELNYEDVDNDPELSKLCSRISDEIKFLEYCQELEKKQETEPYEKPSNNSFDHDGFSVIIHKWPFSQMCMTCQYGEFFQSETFDSQHAFCCISHGFSSRGQCDKFKEI